jgi:transposase
MQLKTILNRVEPFKSFVYGKARWVEGSYRPTLEVEVQARKNGRAICSGCGRPGQPYLNVIAEQLKQAAHILDRFHIMKKMNEAIDEVRRSEARRLAADGYEPVLKHSRWCLLKRPENRTEKETVKLSELLQYNLQSVRSHLLREDFQRLWEYTSRCTRLSLGTKAASTIPEAR